MRRMRWLSAAGALLWTANQVPILLGEFGMQFPQAGGPRYLSDMKDIAMANGWHFCLWSYRGDSKNAASVEFDYEKWDGSTGARSSAGSGAETTEANRAPSAFASSAWWVDHWLK